MTRLSNFSQEVFFGFEIKKRPLLGSRSRYRLPWCGLDVIRPRLIFPTGCKGEDDGVEDCASHGLNPDGQIRPVRNCDRCHRKSNCESRPHESAFIFRILPGVLDRRRTGGENRGEECYLRHCCTGHGPDSDTYGCKHETLGIETRPCAFTVEQQEDEHRNCAACGSEHPPGIFLAGHYLACENHTEHD